VRKDKATKNLNLGGCADRRYCAGIVINVKRLRIRTDWSGFTSLKPYFQGPRGIIPDAESWPVSGII
jgi:hypothetical protein